MLIVGGIIKFILLIVLIVVYFLPTIIAVKRYRENDGRNFNDVTVMFVMNLLGAWMVLSWPILLGLASERPKGK